MPTHSPATVDRARPEVRGRFSSTLRRWLRPQPFVQREIILALLLMLCYGLFRQVPAWNEYSRYDLIVAIVDDRTLRIDRYHENTGDKAHINGHYYSDKAPGTALLGVPVYATVRAAAVWGGIDRPDPERAIDAVIFAVAGLPTIVLVLLLLRFLRPQVGERWALALAAGYGLGSIAFPFATMLFGHATATCFLFASFYLLWRTGPARRPEPFLWAGLLAGWAVLTDLPTIPVVVALLAYAWSHNRRAPLLMGVGALPAAALLLGYNWLAFGNPFSLGYANLANQDFADAMGRGLLGVTLPEPGMLGELLWGPRGLLRLSPWLALAPLGLLAARRPELRREVALCGVITFALLLVNAGYHLPFGGWTPGPRFLLPALPFAAILVALAPRAFRPLVALQLAVSIALCTIATATMPNAPEAVRDPLGDLWLPRLLSGNLVRTMAWFRAGLHGWQPLLLLGGAVIIATIALYATTRPTRWARWLVGAGIGMLAALVLAFGTPIDPLSGLQLTTSRRAAADGAMRIVDAGVTTHPAATGRPTVAIWGQLANTGEVREQTKVLFAVYDPSGERVWAAWYGDVRWSSGERKHVVIAWPTDGVAPGDYRIDVLVTSTDDRIIYARREEVGRVRILR